MAMSMQGAKGSLCEINVTPMIDILLVLLIILMVIVPVTPKGLQASIPRPPQAGASPSPEDPVVVQILGHPGAGPTYKINDVAVPHARLISNLSAIFANRADRVLFVRSDDNVSFAYVADVIDIGKAANLDHIGLMTANTQPGRWK
jgi:biopolymer transport protein TolR